MTLEEAKENTKNTQNYIDKKDFYTKEELASIINLVFNTNITPRRIYELIYNKLHISKNSKLCCKEIEKNKVVYSLDVLSFLYKYINDEINTVKEKILNTSFEFSIKDLFINGTIHTEKCVEMAILNDTKFIDERYKKNINKLEKEYKGRIDILVKEYEEIINKQKQQIADYKHLVDELADKLELTTFEKGKSKGYIEEFKNKYNNKTLNSIPFARRNCENLNNLWGRNK